MDKVSYCLGVVYGQNIYSLSGNKIDYDDFVKGMKVSMNQESPEIPEEEIRRILTEHHNKLNEERQPFLPACLRRSGQDAQRDRTHRSSSHSKRQGTCRHRHG